MSSRRLLAAVCLALIPFTAAATPITIQFSGQLTMGGGTAPPEGEMFVPIIPWMSEFTGSFTYENETPISNQGTGVLQYNNAITGATISFGPGGSLGVFNFAGGPLSPTMSRSSAMTFVNDLEFSTNPSYDQFSLSASMGNLPGDPANMYRYLGFGTADYSGLSIPTGQTLLDPLPLSGFLSGFHQLSFGYSLYNDAGIDVYSSYVGSQNITLTAATTSVPEPGTLPMLGAGLVGIWLATRRRQAVARRVS